MTDVVRAWEAAHGAREAQTPWRTFTRHPKPKHPRRAAEGPPLMGSRAAARWDALDPKVRERIHADAVKAAAAIMEQWEKTRTPVG